MSSLPQPSVGPNSQAAHGIKASHLFLLFNNIDITFGASQVALVVKNSFAGSYAGDRRSLGWENPLEEEMATHPGILAWEISWTEEPGGLQIMGPQRVRQDCMTEHTHACNIYEHFKHLRCLKNFIKIKNSQQSSKIPLSPFYRWGNQGPKRLRILPMVTQGVSGATGVEPGPSGFRGCPSCFAVWRAHGSL